MISIYLHPTKQSSRGQVYRVTLHSPDGEVIVTNSRDPEHAAARELVARGYLGSMCTFGPDSRLGNWAARMTFPDIAITAKRKMKEGSLTALRVAPYQPFALQDDEAA